MSAAFIIDCSITMAWCFADEATPAASKIQDRLEEAVLVPAHWRLEVSTVIAMAEKRKRITAAKSSEFLALLGPLDIEVDHEGSERTFAHVLPLAREHGLTTYDAAYLELALRQRLPLATLDNDLRGAARKLDVAALGK